MNKARFSHFLPRPRLLCDLDRSCRLRLALRERFICEPFFELLASARGVAGLSLLALRVGVPVIFGGGISDFWLACWTGFCAPSGSTVHLLFLDFPGDLPGDLFWFCSSDTGEFLLRELAFSSGDSSDAFFCNPVELDCPLVDGAWVTNCVPFTRPKCAQMLKMHPVHFYVTRFYA